MDLVRRVQQALDSDEEVLACWQALARLAPEDPELARWVLDIAAEPAAMAAAIERARRWCAERSGAHSQEREATPSPDRMDRAGRTRRAPQAVDVDVEG